MIRISRSEQPKVLSENKEKWTEEYLEEYRSTGNTPKNSSSRYGHDEIRTILSSDTHKKCMYCESKISHISYPNVEHIAPKSKYPDKTYDWDNLGLACQVCNTTKGTDYDENLPPINPYEDDPADFLYAFGEILRPRPGSDKGKTTIKDIGLNRAELVEKRSRQLENLQSLAENYARAQNPKAKAMFLQELCIELEADREYVIFTRAIISEMGINCNNL